MTSYFPLILAGVLLNALAGWQLFDEAMDLTRWSGLGGICSRVWVITRNAEEKKI